MTAVIISIVGLVFFNLIAPNITFFRTSQIRQQTNLEARQLADTIQRTLANGKANTVAVDMISPLAPPNSLISFTGMDNSSYQIFWSPTPPNTVHLLKDTNDTVLATNVTSLSFNLDLRDPDIVTATFQIDAPLDNTGQQNYTIVQPDMIIRMATTQQ